MRVKKKKKEFLKEPIYKQKTLCVSLSHGPGLPKNIALLVRKVINELTYDSLLDKCLHGKTQNQNESFNNMVWERLPKSTFVGLQQLSLGIYDAVSNFSIGAKAIINLYERLSMVPGFYTNIGCDKINKKRI